MSDLIAVRAQLRRVVASERRNPLSEDEQARLASALASIDDALATIAGLAGVRYPP